MTNALAQMELTAAQGHIMGFLAHCDFQPCPRDIEEKFQLSHPTVSGLLSRLEKKGFVALNPDPADRRCKRIRVLPKGHQCHALMHRAILENEQRLVAGFTPEEQAQFSALLERAIENMGGSPCQKKEESD
jgi:DNA-binding MarR family transcriptional regulator